MRDLSLESINAKAVAAILCAALVVGVFAVRYGTYRQVVRPDRIAISDPDTLRRLTRLSHLVEPDHRYPYLDPSDGYPTGTTMHWTLPMDAVILALDPVVGRFYPQARPREAGAVWAGPVLAAGALLVFVFMLRRSLGTLAAALPAIAYVLSYDVLAISAFGNGDHHALQHLCSVCALLGLLAILSDRASRGVSILSGAALGLGLWVSVEAVPVFCLMAGASVVGLLAETREARGFGNHLTWVATALTVGIAADRIEHPGAGLTSAWDQVSGLYLYPIAALLVVLASWRFLDRKIARRRFSGAAFALLLTGALFSTPFILSGRLRERVSVELASAKAANRWIRAEVEEYRPLLTSRGFLQLAPVGERFTFLVYLLPLVLFGVARDDRRPLPMRMGLVVLTAGLFAITCSETKFGHLFAIVYPVSLTLGGSWLLGRSVERFGFRGFTRRRAEIAAGAMIILVFAANRSWAAVDRDTDSESRAELMRQIRELPEGDGDRRAVLARWWLGAYLLYDTGKPVVASGYHRNLEGIRDSYRVLLSGPKDGLRLVRLLEERRVRWIVTDSSTEFLLTVPAAFPEFGPFADITSVRYEGHGVTDTALRWKPSAPTTLYWILEQSPKRLDTIELGDLVLRFRSEIPAGASARGETPAYRIYEVGRR